MRARCASSPHPRPPADHHVDARAPSARAPATGRARSSRRAARGCRRRRCAARSPRRCARGSSPASRRSREWPCACTLDEVFAPRVARGQRASIASTAMRLLGADAVGARCRARCRASRRARGRDARAWYASATLPPKLCPRPRRPAARARARAAIRSSRAGLHVMGRSEALRPAVHAQVDEHAARVRVGLHERLRQSAQVAAAAEDAVQEQQRARSGWSSASAHERGVQHGLSHGVVSSVSDGSAGRSAMPRMGRISSELAASGQEVSIYDVG